MADTKISDLTALTGANVADDDEFVIVDTSAAQSKRITRAELANGGFTSLNVTGTVTADGLTMDTSADSAYSAVLGANRTGAGTALGLIKGSWNGTTVAQINLLAGSDTTNKDDGRIQLRTSNAGGSVLNRFQIDENGDISFYDSTGTSQNLFWDASASRLGLGTTSPDKLMHLKTAVNNTAVLRIESTATDSYPYLSLKNDAREYQLTAHGPLGDVFTIYDGTAGSHRFVIDSSGRVGIGVAPTGSWNLQVASSSGASRIRFQNSTTGTTDADGGSIAMEGNDLVIQNSESGVVKVEMGGSERMRLGSTGTLTIGKTAEDIGTAGHAFAASGYAFHTRSGNTPLFINRLTNDGVLTEFRKDGTTVGSIGTSSTGLTIGDGAAGVLFLDSSRILPWNVGTNTGNDANIDLGDSTRRFRTLYLSGGVYLGGTGAANYLDDYEEGTWTPNISGSGGQAITETTAVGYYTKIGNTIHAWFTVICSDNVGDGNYQLLYGLPFTPNTQLGYGLTGNAFFQTGTTGQGVVAPIKVGSSYSQIFAVRDSAGTITTASAYDRIDGHVIYTIS